ncbi:hypothetical protein Patl1_33020 [Pistacia atlantica]|uniref:Uncharacterized protein n=1 Tax=Pistacia atlantica TaxID=434234 RepID=A0ACC1APC3_9ROSI|nr:hypothetical protein Patl1_33020 [Pistacia atlantica]
MGTCSFTFCEGEHRRSIKRESWSICSGGVFRSPFGTFLGAFSLSLGIQTSYYAELMAVFQAADIAETERWSHLWIESDSTYVINGIQKKHIDAPTQLKNRWNIFLQPMEFMKIKCSDILREGNKVADALANLGLKYQGLQLWDNPPEEIRKLLLDDGCGHPNFRNS